jgi:hypothetical protein
MSGDDNAASGSVSRRQILKRIGAGSALVWSAPALTSLGAPAWAQASPAPGACRVTNPFCDPGPLCADAPQCGPVCSGFEQCARTLDGSCVCWAAAGCFTDETPICQTDADCEPIFSGSKCGEIHLDCPSPCGAPRACFLPCTPGSAPQRAPQQRPGVAIAYAR